LRSVQVIGAYLTNEKGWACWLLVTSSMT